MNSAKVERDVAAMTEVIRDRPMPPGMHRMEYWQVVLWPQEDEHDQWCDAAIATIHETLHECSEDARRCNTCEAFAEAALIAGDAEQAELEHRAHVLEQLAALARAGDELHLELLDLTISIESPPTEAQLEALAVLELRIVDLDSQRKRLTADL